jgi:integrase
LLWKDYNSGNDFTGYILIMIYTGMRYGELNKIKKENINLKEKYMIGGIKTEAGIDRQIPICNKIFPIVESLYNQANKKILEMHEKVFYNAYYATLERAGIRRLPPHCCRHTAATALANADIPPAVIIAILGHKNYTHIKIDEMLSAVNKV